MKLKRKFHFRIKKNIQSYLDEVSDQYKSIKTCIFGRIYYIIITNTNYLYLFIWDRVR